MEEDHHSYRHNFCSCEKKAWKKESCTGFEPYDLCDTGAAL